MNIHTIRIKEALKISTEQAMRVQERMSFNGLDFSECTKREFNVAASDAYNDIFSLARYNGPRQQMY